MADKGQGKRVVAVPAPDQRIGRNVATLRVRKKVTQTSIADAMRERGWKWSQAKAWAVEKGEQPLKLAEAEDLAQVLGVDLHELVESAEGVDIERAAGELAKLASQLVDVTREYLEAQGRLEQAVRQVQEGQGASVLVIPPQWVQYLDVTPVDLVEQTQHQSSYVRETMQEAEQRAFLSQVLDQDEKLLADIRKAKGEASDADLDALEQQVERGRDATLARLERISGEKTQAGVSNLDTAGEEAGI